MTITSHELLASLHELNGVPMEFVECKMVEENMLLVLHELLICSPTNSMASLGECVIPTHFNSLQYSATHYNTLQHTATHCNTLQHTTPHCNTLQHTVTHCKTPQHIAIYSITLQHTAAYCKILQHTQHTALHCTTLQHTATHCSTHLRPGAIYGDQCTTF